jgi:hypothetical protein
VADEKRVRSDRQEAGLAKRVGGRVSKGSGSGWRQRQDVRSPGLLWEMKRTDNVKSISIKVADLDQLRHHALQEGRTPVMHIEIGDKRYVVLGEDDFLELTNLEGPDGQG